MEMGKGSLGRDGGGGGGRMAGMGGGMGKGLGRADGQRTLLRTWRCRDRECGGWSWPCRGSCHRCGAPKPPNPTRREDWWITARIPPWAGEEAPAGNMAAGGRRVDVQPRSRVPGMPIKGGGGAKSTGKGWGGSEGGRPVVSRLHAPGAADHGAARPGAGSDDDANATDDEGGGTWATVVRKGRRGKKRDGGEGKGGGGHDSGGGQRAEQAQATIDLPPERIFEPPAEPRQALARKFQAQSDKVERLQASGARAERVQRASDEKDRLEHELRVAGGATEKSLSYSLKAEDERIEKTSGQLDRARDHRQEKVAAIERLQNEIVAVDQLIERIEARRNASIKRREFLAKQKLSESATSDTVAILRQVSAVLSGHDPAQAAAQVLLQNFIDSMLPPTAEFDMVDGDTASEDSNVASDSSPTVPEEGDDAEMVGQGGERGESRLAEARRELARLEAERDEALGRARAWRARCGKRDANGEELRPHDADGDEEMVPPLMPDQVNVVYKDRLEAAAREVRRLARVADAKETPTAQASGGEPSDATTRPQGAPTPAAFVQLAEGAAAIMEQVSAEAQRQRDEESRDSHIAFQERMQRQQEREMAQSMLLAIHKRDIEEALIARQRQQRAPTPEVEAVPRATEAQTPTYGPTGLRLQQQQARGGRADAARPSARAQSEEGPREGRRRRTRWTPEQGHDGADDVEVPPRSRSPTR